MRCVGYMHIGKLKKDRIYIIHSHVDHSMHQDCIKRILIYSPSTRVSLEVVRQSATTLFAKIAVTLSQFTQFHIGTIYIKLLPIVAILQLIHTSISTIYCFESRVIISSTLFEARILKLYLILPLNYLNLNICDLFS